MPYTNTRVISANDIKLTRNSEIYTTASHSYGPTNMLYHLFY